jgi:4-hydroxy-3-methylbut-2-en-1-yl diphosphate synthase IspG/GcpE
MPEMFEKIVRVRSNTAPEAQICMQILDRFYSVPRPVADYINQLKAALAAATAELQELRKTPAQRGDESAARFRKSHGTG